jgi:hypothetical protein
VASLTWPSFKIPVMMTKLLAKLSKQKHQYAERQRQSFDAVQISVGIFEK